MGKKTLGIKIARPRPGEMAIGWVLVEKLRRKPQTGASLVRQHDPAEAALALALSKGAREVELTRYASEEAFENSRPWMEGLSLEDHRLLIARTAVLMQGEGIVVDFKDVGA